MPHFMVRPSINARRFFLGDVPQIGKRLFYAVVHQANGTPTVTGTNTVINYECTLYIGKSDLESLICEMTGSALPGSTNKYDYHLDKQAKLFDGNFLRTLNVPNSLGNYALSSVAVAANHNGFQANGNILIVFNHTSAPMDELVISLHIKAHRNPNSLYSLQKTIVRQLIAQGVRALQPGHPIYNLSLSNFKSLGYEVTHGKTEAENYDAALTSQLFSELPNI